MKWQEFEDGLKDRVGEHETPLDTEALWNKVQPRKRRRRTLFWWWFGGLGLLGGLAGLWFRDSNRPVSLRSESSVVQAETTQAQEQAPSKTSDLQSADRVRSQEMHISTVASVAAERTAAEQRTAFEIQRHHTETGMNTLNNLAIPKGTAIDRSVFSRQDAQMQALESVLEISESTPDNQGITPSFAALPVLPEFVYSTATLYPVLPNSPEAGPPLQSLDPVEKPSFQLGVYTGFSYWTKWSPYVEDHLIGSDPEERLLEASNLGVFYQKPIGRRLAFRAGIQYQRFNSVFNWQKSWVAPNQDQTVLNYYSNGNVDTTYLPGALMESTRTVRHYNRITAISVPVDLKFALPSHRGAAQVFIGVQPNFFQQAKGVMLYTAGNPDYERFGQRYKRRFGLSVRAGLSIERPLNNRFSLLLEPAGAFDLTRRTANGDPERFFQWGMNVGIVYRR